jgi:transcriptional regulator with XRE-family HTH domain
MKRMPELIKIEHHVIVMSEMDFWVKYEIKSIREKRGWSANEWSFLLGYENGYVSLIEDLTSKNRYSAEHLDYIPELLDIPLKDIIPKNIGPGTVKINAIKYTYRAYVEYEATIEFDGDRSPLNMTFREFTDKIVRFKLDPSINAFTLNLIRSGFFDESKSTIAIFKKYKDGLVKDVKPIDINKSLLSFIRKGKSRMPLLIRIKNRYGRFKYSSIE